ncbi:uncharacterized protein METZ01_LOCUS202437, partial [marine metagenome]
LFVHGAQIQIEKNLFGVWMKAFEFIVLSCKKIKTK